MFADLLHPKRSNLPVFWRLWLRGFILFTPVAAVACGSPAHAPVLDAAPPAPVVAKVAIPVPCEIEQVPMPDYPGNLIRPGDDLYTLARLAMADRRVRIAERDRLRAANANPCPAGVLEKSK